MNFPRSPELLSAGASALVVIDVQERLLPAMRDGERLVANIRRLLEGAAVLGVSATATEQNPAKLGATVSPLAELLPVRHAKMAFSAAECGELLAAWNAAEIRQVVLCGIEAHVCVLQSTLDILAMGYEVHVVSDAVSSRHQHDHDVALARLASSGATITTTEAVLFEWCATADRPEFKAISALVKG
jgi:nicotinamidase-related amidase